jgi:C-terminal processing protease CtpA/Prc
MKATKSRLILKTASLTLFLVTGISRLAADEPKPTAAVQKPDVAEQKLIYQNDIYAAKDALRECNVNYLALVIRTDSLIGVDTTPTDDVLRSHLGLAEGKGVVVSAVTDESPAAKAKIQKNDVLITVADEEITGAGDLEKLLQQRVEKSTPIGLIRCGKKQTVEVVPRLSKAPLDLKAHDARVAFEPRFWLGVGLASADDTLRSHLAIALGEGLVVTQIEENSPAAKAGLMVNDLLLKLDGKSLTAVEALEAQLQEVAGKPVSLELLRRGKPATLTVTPERHAVQNVSVNFTDARHRLSGVLLTDEAYLGMTTNQVLLDYAANQPQSDVAKQIGELREQVKQLQKSLEALDATVKAETAATAGEKK